MHIALPVIAALMLVLAGASAASAQAANVTNAVVCNEEASRQATPPSALPAPKRPPSLTPERGVTTDPSGSLVTDSNDALVQGMATDGLNDPAYRSAYRDCMSSQTRGNRR